MSTDPSVWDEIRRCEEQYERNPESLVFARLADAYRKAGEVDLALKVVADGISRHPDYATGHIVLARCHRDLGGLGEAIAAFQRVSELDPTNLVAIRSLGELSRESGDREQAREWYTKLAQLDPTNDDTARALADLGGAVEATASPEEDSGASGTTDPAPLSGGGFVEPEPLAGESTWASELSDTPEPTELGDVLAGLEPDRPSPQLDNGELLDWSTGELVSESEPGGLEDDPFASQAADSVAEPEDEPAAPNLVSESEDSSGGDDLWLKDLDAMLVSAPTDEQEDSESTLELEQQPETAADDWFSAPGPLDAVDRADGLIDPTDGAVEIPETELPEFGPASGESISEFEAESEVTQGSDSPVSLPAPEAESLPEPEAEFVPEPEAESPPGSLPGPMDWLAGTGGGSDLIDVPVADEPPAQASSPEEPAAAGDAPWWEELAQAGLNVGAGAEIEHLVDDEAPVDEGEELLDMLLGDEGREVPDEPTPPSTDDADIMTRTMADLYVEQGLFEEAIEIYEELLVDRPDDDDLKSRLESVRARRGGAELPPAPAASEEAAADRDGAVEPFEAFDGDDTVPLEVYQPVAAESEMPAMTEPSGGPAEHLGDDTPEDESTDLEPTAAVIVPEAIAEPETGPWIVDELSAILRDGERLADERGDDVPPTNAVGAAEGVLEEWLRRLEG